MKPITEQPQEYIRQLWEKCRPKTTQVDQQAPPTREEMIKEIRAQIEAGTYETDEKISVAAERMLPDVVGKDGMVDSIAAGMSDELEREKQERERARYDQLNEGERWDGQ